MVNGVALLYTQWFWMQQVERACMTNDAVSVLSLGCDFCFQGVDEAQNVPLLGCVNAGCDEQWTPNIVLRSTTCQMLCEYGIV